MRLVWLSLLALWSGMIMGATNEPVVKKEEYRGREILRIQFPVYENRATRTGRKINLNVLVLPALEELKKNDAIFFLAGGPGQAASILLRNVGSWDALRKHRDVVLVDQRGTGQSNPLICDPGNLKRLLESYLGFDMDPALDCRGKWDADLSLYTTPMAMDDLDDIRQWLGYETINLIGGSYGTRAALVYLRRHEPHVRSVILRGVNTPMIPIMMSFAQTSQAALDGILDACAKDPACKKAYPNPKGQLAEVLKRLAAKPAKIKLEDPRNGKEAKIKFDHIYFGSSLLFSLYDHRLHRRVPKMIDAAYHGNYQPVAELGTQFSVGLANQLHLGMAMSILCAEDLPFYEMDQLAAMAKNAFLDTGYADILADHCRNWPKVPLPANYREPIRSNKPVLVVSGQFDPVTPPDHGASAAKHLSNSRHVIVPFRGHFLGAGRCERQMTLRFIDTADVAAIDETCLQENRPPRFDIKSD